MKKLKLLSVAALMAMVTALAASLDAGQPRAIDGKVLTGDIGGGRL